MYSQIWRVKFRMLYIAQGTHLLDGQDTTRHYLTNEHTFSESWFLYKIALTANPSQAVIAARP